MMGVKEENEGFPNLKRFCFGPLKSFEDASDEGVLGELDNLAVELVVVRLNDNIIVGLDGKVVNMLDDEVFDILDDEVGLSD